MAPLCFCTDHGWKVKTGLFSGSLEVMGCEEEWPTPLPSFLCLRLYNHSHTSAMDQQAGGQLKQSLGKHGQGLSLWEVLFPRMPFGVLSTEHAASQATITGYPACSWLYNPDRHMDWASKIQTNRSHWLQLPSCWPTNMHQARISSHAIHVWWEDPMLPGPDLDLWSHGFNSPTEEPSYHLTNLSSAIWGPLSPFPTLHHAVSPVARTASSWPSAQTVELASLMSVDLMSAVPLPKWTQGLP